MSVLELKVPPPIVALVLALLMWLTPPVAGLAQMPSAARVLCAVLLLCVGQGIGFAGMVTRGEYRRTGNPMYLGLLLTLLGKRPD